MVLSCSLISRNIAFGTLNYQNYSRCFSLLHTKLRGRYQLRKLNNQTRAASQVTKAAHMFHPSDVPLSNQTIGELLSEAAATWPERVCVISNHQNVSLTFSDLRRRVDTLAAGLKKLGLKKGDRLGIWGPNDIEWIITSLSASRIGLINVNINPAYQQSELEFCLRKVGIKAIVSPATFKTQNYPKMLLAVKATCPTLEHIIIYSQDHVTGTRRFVDVEALATRTEVDAIAAEQSEISCDDEYNIQFTSGSTGQPKASVLSHKNFVNNSKEAFRRAQISTEDKICLNVPLFHAFGLLMGQTLSLNAGCTIVIEAPSYNPIKTLEAIAKEKCSAMYGTPTMWVNVIETQKRLQLPTNSLRWGFIAGASSTPEHFKQIRDVLGFNNIMSLYGLTESTGVVFQGLLHDDHHLVDTTVGQLAKCIEAMVVDENGLPVPYGTPGELWIRGYANMKRYWNDEENTRKMMTQDGWLKTGDQFILHENGYGAVVGRLKDMIIRGGENIFPKEIENLLMTHPKIQEVQVIGAYDKVFGEEICACIQLCDGQEMTEKELKEYCKGKIAHFKIPRYVAFVDSYPKTGSGKIQKFRLRQQMERDGVIPVK
ncbi:hypothetical protein DMN91_002608 [Ooceraea biroi]|uniref:Medium-chain acyl-CoA ligase ACSF2, mitochondrial n=1 Tax=Ooceraea biroi TaxID=2015173 RepID=A0A026X3N8_OOCBI|nr:acyl-CoA synthetase family member 2, mitochondrial [Ooceraea biroi]XP_026824521.1 acyl-CoA synthetase family member 2, mitochondrial [Ooceraea biroi]EZA62892.1 Acyl-CoA synthetase family member 2, mitochondrial [Ooceraea biroi]RLU24519.1 hypothetical protein DMN91_002608 [Ooceraea biroi]